MQSARCREARWRSPSKTHHLRALVGAKAATGQSPPSTVKGPFCYSRASSARLLRGRGPGSVTQQPPEITVQHRKVQHSTVQHSAAQHSGVHHSTAQQPAQRHWTTAQYNSADSTTDNSEDNSTDNSIVQYRILNGQCWRASRGRPSALLCYTVVCTVVCAVVLYC